jgi:hypothetical protein
LPFDPEQPPRLLRRALPPHFLDSN